MEYCTIQLTATLECKVEISVKRIRRCYLRVYPSGKVAVSVPLYFSDTRIEKFIQNNAKWLEKKLLNLADNEIKKSNKIFYMGKEYAMECIEGKSFVSEIAEDKIILYTPYFQDTEKARRQFFDSIKRESYALYRFIIDGYCDKYPKFLPKPTLKVRSMVSWGLYNKTRNEVTMNCKLMQADIESIKMVVFHELCHIIEQNHSKKFYALLKVEYPNYKIMRKNLNKYSTRI